MKVFSVNKIYQEIRYNLSKVYLCNICYNKMKCQVNTKYKIRIFYIYVYIIVYIIDEVSLINDMTNEVKK